MKILFFSLVLLSVGLTPVFAEQVIFSEGKEYEIGEITKEYLMTKHSHIIKTEGYTTTGEMFFLRSSPTFEKVMLLDTSGEWKKAELKEKSNNDVPSNTESISGTVELHYLIDHYDQVYNKESFKFFVKTFDKSIYNGNDFQNFQGKISGAKVSAIILDPDGEVRADFEGIVEHGLYEGSVLVPQNLWQKGWYTVDLVIEYDGKFYPEQLTFYVLGRTVPSDSSSP